MGALCCKMCSDSCCGGGSKTPRPEVWPATQPFGDAGSLTVATDPGILFIGRCRTNGTDLEYSHPSAMIRFVVSGPSKQVGITMCLAGPSTKERLMLNAKGNGVFMNVWRDGVRTARIKLETSDPAQAKQYIIAEDLPAGDTTIEVTRGTEANYGLTVVKGINIPDGAKLQAAVKGEKKVVEFVGDSDTAGTGSLGPNFSFNAFKALGNFTHWSDPDYAAPAFVGRMLGVDVHNLGVGGQGLIITDDTVKNRIKAGENYADRVQFSWGRPNADGKQFPAAEEYSVGEMPHVDLVVVWIGQNDIMQGCAGKIGKGQAAYKALLQNVRKHRPKTKIVCLYPGGVIHSTHPGYIVTGAKNREAVQNEIKKWAEGAASELGGEAEEIFVRGVEMEPGFDPSSDYGVFGEIGVDGQKKWARGVAKVLTQITGWEKVADIEEPEAQNSMTVKTVQN